MSIKKKSTFLVMTFLILLVFNGLGLFYSTHKIEEANKDLIEKSNVSIAFMELKYIIKELQEIATDTALIGTKEGLDEIADLESSYFEMKDKIDSMNLDTKSKQHLDMINTYFVSYSTSLTEMAEFGIKRVTARVTAAKEMKVFDSYVEHIEKDISKLRGVDKYQLLELKYMIVSIQEILTDALAVGDTSGFEESEKIFKEFNKKISKLSSIYTSLKYDLKKLKQDVAKMHEVGQKMAKKGSTFKFMIFKTNATMEVVDGTAESIEKDVRAVIKNQEEQLEVAIKHDLEVIDTLRLISLILTIALFVLILMLLVVIKNILKNINSLNDGVVHLLISDDLDSKVVIDSKDELSVIANNFNKYLDSLTTGMNQDREVIKEAKRVIGKVNAGLYNVKISKTPNSHEIGMLIHEINDMIKKSEQNFTVLSDSLTALSQAKYDYKIPTVEGITGLVASLFGGTKVTQATINEVIALIDNSNKRLTFSAKDLSEAAKDLSESSNTQAVALEQTAAAVDEVASTVTQSTENTSKMASYAQSVTKSSEVGKELANKTSTSMDELSNEVSSIHEAITIIDQIAFQTNILSLNAAVEAATAGEAGKGFAVVAQEVRNLASRSAEAANDIKQLVDSANTKAQDGKKVSSQMIEGYNELNEKINLTIETIEEVVKASKEQQVAISQISDTINSLDHATQQNASLSMQISKMANNTEDLAHELQACVDRTSFEQEAKRRVCVTDYIFDINKLKSDHIVFKNTNFKECKVGNKFTVKKHTECDMGKWIEENKNSELAQTQEWKEMVEVHKRVHDMVQDTVDLYAEDYENGQIIAVTDNIEKEIDKIFGHLDTIREKNCNLIFEKKRRGE